MYKKVTLDNGLTIVLSDMPSMESVSVGIWIRAGGRYETKEQSGISHFLEHMVFKGTKKRSAQDLKEAIEGRGGALNGFTGEEFTCYLAKVLSKDTKVALDILSDMTLQPRLHVNDFLKERFVILEEIKMYIDMPNHHVHELLAELIWPDQPLGRSLAGTFESVSALQQKDLAAYKDRFYNPGNIVVSIAGKLPSFDLIKDVKRIFGQKDKGPEQVFIPVKITQKKPATNLFFKETEQTHIAIGLHGYSRFSKEKYKLDLLHVILGGNMSSRLFQEVRENLGLAYEISSSVKHYHDTGALIISAGIDNKKVSRAVKVIIGQLRNLKRRLVTKEEFRRAKEFYRGQFLMMFEETMNHMLWLGEKFMCHDEEFKIKDVLRRIDEVTIDDIRIAANKVLTAKNINLSAIGPVAGKDGKEIKKMLYDL